MDNRPWKRPLDEVSSNEPAAKKAATADIFSMMMFGGLGGGMKGMRSLRGEQGNMTRQFNKLAAEDWARRASERPYALSDLAVPEKSAAAYAFFDGLSLAETKHECAAQGLPITGAKYKLLASLVKHARARKPDRGGGGGAATTDANKVRRALVADLRKGLVWDKKMKKTHETVKKRLKASYANCGPAVFGDLFPAAGAKATAKISVADLQVDAIAKSMRYGGRLVAVDGSLTAKVDAGTVTVTGMYTYSAL